jgi:hypothetical protein
MEMNQMTNPRRLIVISTAVVAALLLLSGSVALAVKSTTVGQSVVPAQNLAAGNATSVGHAYPYPGPGPFEPGPPPFSQLSGDGLIAWGVAFKEVSDPNAQPDEALIKSAYQDAQKRAQALASAAGIKLGSLLAITDSTQDRPYYKPCPPPALEGSPQPGAPTQVLPAPVQGKAIAQPFPCSNTTYLVAWVSLRYAIQS